MCVDLRCSEGSVTEQFLDAPQVRAALQQVGSGGVPQPVRAQISHSVNRRKPVMDDLTSSSRVDPPTS
jgi:hypothetical protein